MKKTIYIAIAIAALLIAAGVYQSQRNTVKPVPENQNTGITQKQAEIIPENQNNESKSEASTSTSQTASSTPEIKTFEECVAKGYKVEGKSPYRDCTVNDNLVYLEVETCKAPTGESMSYFEALNLFNNEHCSWEGSPKETHFCNETTGTWWIDIQTYRKGCNPACVINVATKKAEVNWRCTGAIEK